MLNKNKRYRLFARRTLLLAGFKGGLLCALIGRLYYLQIVQADKYKTFSDSNRIKLFLIPPLRGKILDRSGRNLAVNQNYYRILFDPEITSNKKNTLDKLAQVLGLDTKSRQRMFDKVSKHKSRRSLMLYEHLSWEEVSKVEVNSPDLPGVSIDVGQIRYFPMGKISPHILGYLGPVSEKEITANPLLNHPDFKVGRSGVEKVFEHELRGMAGVRRMEVDAFGLTVSEISREISKPGKDLTLSIDRRLQELISQRLNNKSGSALVMDMETGELLAISSAPEFDPNRFTYGVSSDYWNELLKDDQKPLINKAISSQYPPGSTFKMVVSLAALGEGVDPEAQIYCPGHVDLGRRRFHCWKKGGHGYVDMHKAIKHSCNSYFYTISKKVGIEKIAAMAHKFGLGHLLDLKIPGEKPGLVPSKEWKRTFYGDIWQSGDTLNAGIGQGFMLATPLQLVVMVSRIATGKKIFPRLLPQSSDLMQEQAVERFEKLDIPEEHLEIVRRAMTAVVNEPGGTAYGSRIKEKPFSMVGKTGTSQVVSKKVLDSTVEFLSDTERKKTENHALFVGYGPVEKPRYAVSVVVEHGGGGSVAAAPIARDILHQVQKLYKS